MSNEHFHDILMIWLLRRLDLTEAKKQVSLAYGELVQNGELDSMSKDDVTVYMLDIVDRYELPHSIHCFENYQMLKLVPF